MSTHTILFNGMTIWDIVQAGLPNPRRVGEWPSRMLAVVQQPDSRWYAVDGKPEFDGNKWVLRDPAQLNRADSTTVVNLPTKLAYFTKGEAYLIHQLWCADIPKPPPTMPTPSTNLFPPANLLTKFCRKAIDIENTLDKGMLELMEIVKKEPSVYVSDVQIVINSAARIPEVAQARLIELKEMYEDGE